jgi:hypothetical protein
MYFIKQHENVKCLHPKTSSCEGKDYHLDESCTKLFECDKYLGSAQDVNRSKALFVGVRAFMHVAKKGNAFLIYVLPTLDVVSPCHEIPS